MTSTILDRVKARKLQATGLKAADLTKILTENEHSLHDPLLYDDMQAVIDHLHAFALACQQDPQLLLMVDTDYDTDGVMAACVMAASLAVFEIPYQVYCPNMEHGYGLSPIAVDEMLAICQRRKRHLGLILTADNGTNAVNGVSYAQEKGIEVLVTDHHLTTKQNAPALAIVNPNKTMADGSKEPYPFKGNAGGCVIWKVFLAYAQKYAPDKYQLIYDLIVFAGIANVADVMPIVDENHYIVKQAVCELNRLWSIYDLQLADSYSLVKKTAYPNYDAVFHGLYDLLAAMQNNYNYRRQSAGKKARPLVRDEELIAWYLAPAINASRRVSGSSAPSMMALIAPDPQLRQRAISQMLEMNQLKTVLRDAVVDDLFTNHPEQVTLGEPTVLFVNTRHGISGLIAAQIAEKTKAAVIVFALNTDSPVKLYQVADIQALLAAHPDLEIAASARSFDYQPLNLIISRIRSCQNAPIIAGGGHALAAGYRIALKDYQLFKMLFTSFAKQVQADLIRQLGIERAEQNLPAPIENTICFTYHLPNLVDDNQAAYLALDTAIKPYDELLDLFYFENQFKPFGRDFNVPSHFRLMLNSADLEGLDFDRSFWKTFKFNLYGVSCLTFDLELAAQVLRIIDHEPNQTLTFDLTLKLNRFRGQEQLQFILS